MQVSNHNGHHINHPILVFAAAEQAARLSEAAAAAGLPMEIAKTAADLSAGVETSRYPVTVVQHGISDLEPAAFLESLRALPRPVVAIFLIEAGSAASDAAQLIRLGAYHCADAATSREEWSQLLEQAAEEARCRRLACDSEVREWRRLLVGESAAIEELLEVISLVAARRSPVLITGEAGTGKETAARAIHLASGRGHLPMVTLNCSALPEHALEAELFGHTSTNGAGAAGSRLGRLEQAAGSSLFLDGIGDLPMDLQGRLLRALEEQEFERPGSSETVQVKARVIAASDPDLFQRVKQGKFREDLYYALNVVPIQMPPLRERRTDIRLLARHFVVKVCAAEGLPSKEVFNETLDHLCGYSWPGNVRQLENTVAKAVIMSGPRRILLPSDFELPDEPPPLDVTRSIEQFAVPDGGINFAQVVSSFQRNLLDQALKRTNGNRTMAADLLRMKRTTLVSKLRVLELT